MALLVLAAGGESSAFAAAQSVYLSPLGSGTACSQTAPCNITQAQITARSLASAGTGNVNVTLGGGTYQLSLPLIFSAQDSGVNGYKVIWQAAPAAKPVISGGMAITGWAVDTVYSNLWSTTSRPPYRRVSFIRMARACPERVARWVWDRSVR